ncbi:MAG: hypothetical protein WEE89_14415 [Gemmatimonadota bacterium]
MSNKFLDEYGYIPEEEPVPKAADQPTGVGRQAVPSAFRAKTFRRAGTAMLAVLAIAVGVLADDVFGAAYGRIKDRLRRFESTPLVVPDGNFGASEVERYGSLPDAIHDSPPHVISLLRDLNEPGMRRFDIPFKRARGTAPTYGLRPRPGFERQFGELIGTNLNRISIYTIRIPISWSAEKLELHKYRWASWCGVTIEWIDRWSEFRPSDYTNRKNNCHADGTCIIVSTGCNKAIFTDLEG